MTNRDTGYIQWLDSVAAEPWRYDFYQLLRRIEALNPHLPRLGEALRPSDEPVEVTQPAELSFAPAPIQGVKVDGRRPRIQQRIFGLTGPHGPLPTRMTELTRERREQAGDPTLQRFLDLLTHRFALLFYRAWAQAQLTVSLDRRNDHGSALRLGALFGIGAESLMQRDAAGDAAKLHFTGRLARQVRDADGLLQWCRSEFDAPVRIEQWRGHWMPLDPADRTRLSSSSRNRISRQLGRGAVLGSAVWDVQHKFRIIVGPLSEARYHAYLPGGSDLARLQSMVRQWVGLEFEWDLQLILQRSDVPQLRLGRTGELGRSSWLGHYRKPHDADDLVIDVERTLTRARARHAASSPSTLHPSRIAGNIS